jgi:hypothetical protein
MTQAKHPLFPNSIADMVADLNTKKDYLQQNMSRLGIPNGDMSNLITQVAAVSAAQTVVNNEDTRTKLDFSKRDLALDTAQVSMRRIIDFYVTTSPNATSVDLEALNIPKYGGYHPRLPAPDVIPGIRRIVSHNLRATIPFFDALSGKRAKPDGVLAIEAYLKIGGEPPKDIHEMNERKVATASPMVLQFEPEKEFEPLYIAFRWIGTRGDYGPWSEIYKTVILR